MFSWDGSFFVSHDVKENGRLVVSRNSLAVFHPPWYDVTKGSGMPFRKSVENGGIPVTVYRERDVFHEITAGSV